MRSYLLLAALLMSGCTGSSGLLGTGDDDDITDDDDASANDDDASDDDDITDDDDATPPKTLEEGFLMWDPESQGGPNGNGPAVGYAILPRGSIATCDQFMNNYGYDTDENFVGLYFLRGRAIEWEGDYAEFYADCRPNQPDARCFAAWGGTEGGDSWESNEHDTLSITAWGETTYGVVNVRGEDLGFALRNCGETDFDGDYDGDSGAPNGDEAAPLPAEDSEDRGRWKLRFK